MGFFLFWLYHDLCEGSSNAFFISLPLPLSQCLDLWEENMKNGWIYLKKK